MKFKYTIMATAIAFAFSAGAVMAQQAQDPNIRTELEDHGFEDKESHITQSGSDNEATTTQTGHGGGGGGAYSVVNQTGDENDSNVTQDSPYTYSRVKQEGSVNDADVTQTGSNVNTYSWVEQGDSQGQGVGNTASITQTDSAWTGSVVVQSGSNNDAIVTQQDHSDGGPLTESHIYQTGDLNIANVDQTNAKGSLSDIFQVGNDNNADVTQENAPNSDSDILQSGSFNTAIVIQKNGIDSESFITQYGNGHYAEATQLDTNQTSTINQSNGAAITTHHQSGGSSNLATTIQN